uniref:PLD phosphodiesterase domain-containing protein n=1 Tax=Palpitomonas bilix TaxID=652834 RepID=A0A7S3GBZ5_9EUKA|mmetsp:Transcript_3947/g.7504  ORF Transcript_3947/g.7504 Transcript_3947/m.7504 type:complete len:482 (+) Transcript_3947:37-1482(+)
MRSAVFAVVTTLLLATAGLASNVGDTCRYSIVESIPDGLNLTTLYKTSDAFIDLMSRTEKNLHIASFYWELSHGDPKLGGDQGQRVFDEMINTAKRGVDIQITQTFPTAAFPQYDAFNLSDAGYAEVRSLDFSKLFGSGVLHTKMWIGDGKHAYVGSANTDWKSMSQVKELGVYLEDCPELVKDLESIFQVYWQAAEMSFVPPRGGWASDMAATMNMQKPLDVAILNALTGKKENDAIFFAAAPPSFLPDGFSKDDDAIVGGIDDARESVCVEVMDYAPASVYMPATFYWPSISDAFKRAAFNRQVEVRLLFGIWNHTTEEQYGFMKELQSFGRMLSGNLSSPSTSARASHQGRVLSEDEVAYRSRFAPPQEMLKYGATFGSLDVKVFKVPDDPKGVASFTRVNHAKFLVTDRVAYIGTSNWCADYFYTTAGVSANFRPLDVEDDQSHLRAHLQTIFDRDWNSEYAIELDAAIREFEQSRW